VIYPQAMRELVAFLASRLAEQEQQATGWLDSDLEAGWGTLRDAAEQLLRDITAKRAHIARWRKVTKLLATANDPAVERNRAELRSVWLAYSNVLADDAQAYADHPDYREEWRP
jgi:5'-deoxynucleotidase YfbR-like HD superfamily hydrolase